MMEVRRSDLILSLIINLDLGTIEVSNLARNLRHLDITLFCTCNHLFFSYIFGFNGVSGQYVYKKFSSSDSHLEIPWKNNYSAKCHNIPGKIYFIEFFVRKTASPQVSWLLKRDFNSTKIFLWPYKNISDGSSSIVWNSLRYL